MISFANPSTSALEQQVARFFSERGALSKTQNFMTSGYSDETLASQGLMLPDHPFLRKPFTTSTLACKVREVLASPSAST